MPQEKENIMTKWSNATQIEHEEKKTNTSIKHKNSE